MTKADSREQLWLTPGTIKDPKLKAAHAFACDQVRDELEKMPAHTFADVLIAERSVTLYFVIRDLESKMTEKGIADSFGNQRNYKELHQMWLAIVALHKRTVDGVKGDSPERSPLSIVADVLDKHDPDGALGPLRKDIAKALDLTP